MEFLRLDSSDVFSNALEFSHDSRGPLELSAPHVLWTNNCAATSQLWPLEFVAAKTRIFIVDISKRGPGSIKDTIDLVETPPNIPATNPWWDTSPRGVTYLRLATLLNREVLLATTEEGYVYVWRTLALSLGDKTPWFEYKCQDSAWGADIHKSKPLLVVSDNSGRVTLLQLTKASDDRPLDLQDSSTSQFLGGNIPCVSFIKDHIAYTMLTLDLLAGSFGLLDLDLELIYTIKMQQAGWCIQPIGKSFLPVHSAVDFCGSQKTPLEFQLVECRDVCNASYLLNRLSNSDRLGFRRRWIEPQTWVKEQQLEIKEWIKHGRRKSLATGLESLKDECMLLTTSTHGFLVEASSGKCLASAERALLPPTVVPSEEFRGLALSIIEYIKPLSVAIVISRAATVVALRFTERHSFIAMRQELVLCDFPDFIVGSSSCPARAHDFEYDLRHLNMAGEASWTQDVPDKSLGDVGTYLVRLHTKDGGVEAFLVSAPIRIESDD